MRFFSSRVGFIIGVFILVVVVGVFFFNKINTTFKLSYQNNFSQTASLPLSSADKIGIKPFSTNKDTVFWQDGMFLYRSKANDNSPVPPYALTGRINAVSDRYFEIVPFTQSKSFLNAQQKVTVQLLAENGDAATLQRKNGQVVSSPLNYTLIKTGDMVEIYSLKPVGKDSYNTTQIFVLVP